MSEQLCARLRSDTAREKVKVARSVETMPITKRADTPYARLAALCVLGEYMDINDASQYIVNPLVYMKRSDIMSDKEWLTTALADYTGVMNELSEHAADDVLYYGHGDVDYHRRIIDIAKQHSVQITAVLERVFEHNLAEVKWDILVEAGMKPYSASSFLLKSRPCENVMLTARMLDWMRVGDNCLSRYVRANIPTETPHAHNTYQMYEYWARRSQRIVFPGYTSLQCQLMIDLPCTAFSKGGII